MSDSALYSVGTWDGEAQAYTPQANAKSPAINVDLRGLRRHLRELRDRFGYDATRGRFDDGERWSDWAVLVERTDGASEVEILEGWKR